MTFSLFNKNRCSITDELFLELTWDDGRGLEEDSELLDIIEGLDHLSNFSQPISKSLPYLTFQQAELLFKELKQAYGRFQLKKVAIAHLEGKSVVTEGEVYASPFLITEDYENLLLPLIQAILTRSEFANYSYQEKGNTLRIRFILYINKVWDCPILLFLFSQLKVRRWLFRNPIACHLSQMQRIKQILCLPYLKSSQFL